MSSLCTGASSASQANLMPPIFTPTLSSSRNSLNQTIVRLNAVSAPVTLDERLAENVPSVVPKKRQDVLNWAGWGYKDSKFYVDKDVICFQGKPYPLHGCALPLFTKWVAEKFNLHVETNTPIPNLPQKFPEPSDNPEFLQELQASRISYSQAGEDRLIRCHGQTLHDIYCLRLNGYARIPDVIAWPRAHEEVERLVALAHKHNVVVIPFGGGTSVSGSVTCPQQEQRMICVLDTSQMNRLLWLNRENLTVCFECGIIGQDLERVLRQKGLTVGHEPDSYEFSTLGGWVATRASGMKKNTYGNIEDLIVRVKMVTAARGVLERECAAPRLSCGPDFNHLVLGSEGTLGVVTEVVLKVRPLPPVKRYGSLVFPDFELGVQFMRELARRRCQPASVRLVDNEQFSFGQSLRAAKGWAGNALDYLKKVYVTHVKGLDLKRICAATLLFEGEAADVRRQESQIYEIAAKYKGFPAGGQNGERGYILTFVIAYIRDFGLNHEVVAESFETSVPWDRCSLLCRNVKRRVEVECHRRNIQYFIISFRVTQTYDAGACVYFYFAFRASEMADPVAVYESIESNARDEILASGGSVSHHHGVGKVRSRWYQSTVSPAGRALYMAAKRELDPKNIFAAGNLLTAEQWKHFQAGTDATKLSTLKVKSKTAVVQAKL